MSNVILPPQGILKIRAYCSDCNTLLQESNLFTTKQLKQNWDRAVIGAVHMKCDKCGHKFPNFSINLKVVNTKTGREYNPSHFIKLPKNRETPDELFRSISKKWLKDHPEASTSKEVSKQDAINEALERRKQSFT